MHSGESSAAAPPDRGRAARRSRRVRVLFALVGIVLLGLAVRAVLGNQDELVGAFDTVTHPIGVWLAVAIAVELASYLAYAAAQRRLLCAGGAAVGVPVLWALAIAVQAVGNCLPAGATLSTVVTFRELRRRRVHEALTVWMLVVVGALYPALLAILAVIGVQVAGGEGPASGVQSAAYVVIGVLAAAAIAASVLRRRGLLGRATAALVRWVRRLPGLRRTRLGDGAREGWHLGHIELGGGGWTLVAAMLTVAWLTDLACLAASFAAVGAPVPWRGLLLAYCAGQLAAMLPITPGGLGVVEGSLTVALVAYGGAQDSTLAAVLLYRLISFWGVLVLGAGTYAGVRITAPRPGGASARPESAALEAA